MIQRCALPSRGFLCLSGKDALTFLQGYATCDLAALDHEPRALPGAICNIKGRMLTSFLVAREGEDLLLRMHRPLVALTLDFLAKYIVFSKASMRDASDDWHCYGELGGAERPAFALAQAEGALRISLGYGEEVWSQKPLPADADEAPWQAREVAEGMAWVQEATSERFLPQMFNYHNLGAVDFDKGCYLGQEVVARAQYRGQLKRQLQPVAVAGAQPGDACEGGVIVAASKDRALAVVAQAG